MSHLFHLLPVKGFSAINFSGIIVARREQGDLEERVLRHEAIQPSDKELWGIVLSLVYR